MDEEDTSQWKVMINPEDLNVDVMRLHAEGSGKFAHKIVAVLDQIRKRAYVAVDHNGGEAAIGHESFAFWVGADGESLVENYDPVAARIGLLKHEDSHALIVAGSPMTIRETMPKDVGFAAVRQISDHLRSLIRDLKKEEDWKRKLPTVPCWRFVGTDSQVSDEREVEMRLRGGKWAPFLQRIPVLSRAKFLQ